MFCRVGAVEADRLELGTVRELVDVAGKRVLAMGSGEELGELRHEPFLDDLRATEGGMADTVRRGLFERVGERTHDIATHFDDAGEMLDEWLTEDEDWASPELRQRLE